MTASLDPESLPAVFPVQTASRVLGIGRNQTYELIRAGRYPVRVLELCGHYRVSKYDLLAFLGAPGYTEDTADESTVRELRPSRGRAAS